MADISKIKLTDGTTCTIKDAAVRERVTALENAGSGFSVQYEKTLTKGGWKSSTKEGSVVYTYTLSLPELTCGNAGNVSPLISWTSNYQDYSYIDEAEATAGVGIVFTTKTAVSDDIGILIIDLR